MKAVDLLINSKLPVDLRRDSPSLDAKGLSNILANVAQKYPDRYEEISQGLADIGREAAFRQGETIGMDDLRPVVDRKALYKEMDRELKDAQREFGHDKAELRRKKEEIWVRYSDRIEKLTGETALKNLNNIALSVASGARGKSQQLKAMISTPGVYTDSKGNLVPMFIRRSYSEGLRPAEYLAGTYGARLSVTGAKTATARGGDLGKQLANTAATQVVTEKNCGTHSGLEFGLDEPSLQGRVLAQDAGSLKAGTVLGKAEMRILHKEKPGNVVVRSAMTCQAPKGLCSFCLGRRPGGKFASVGDSVGIEAAQTVSEPFIQGGLSMKHCLHVGTEVRMADLSVKRIEDIVVGDWVLGSDVEGNTFPVQVLATWDQGIQPVYRYGYAKGKSKDRIYLESTDCHELLSNKKVYGKNNGKAWVSPGNNRAVKLPAGYPHKNIAAVLPITTRLNMTVEEPYALLCGALLGDGIRWDHIKYSEQSVRFSCADPSLIKDLNAWLKPDGLKLVKRKRSHDYAITYRTAQGFSDRDAETGRMKSAPETRHLVKKKLLEWGMAGKYAHDKTVPASSLYWRQADVAALIAGYIATDGCVGRTEVGDLFVSFGSVSRELLEGVRKLLMLRLCIYPGKIQLGSVAGTNNYVHDMWTFSITRKDQISKLFQILPPIPGVKGPRFEKLMQEDTRKFVNAEPFYRAMRKSVEFLGNLPCRDITVSHPDELFVLANGLIVSNTAGMAKGKRTFSGLDYIAQFTQSPETFKDRAAVAEEDGVVSAVEKAPQGGYFVTVNDEKQYVPPGFEVIVKQGDQVEAGDQLSEGLIDPEDIVRLRGLGEGRKYYAERLHQILEDSGHGGDRRNMEILARAAVDHVRIDDSEGLGDYLPDDIASYNRLSAEYVPPENTQKLSPRNAIGQYLQAPVLHYTIGTRITPRVAKHLGDRNQDIFAAPDAPQFSPQLRRLRTAAANVDRGGFISGMTGSYLKDNLQFHASRGTDEDVGSNVHYAPRLAFGQSFGEKVKETGEF